jgi:hypothetical protein
LQVKARWCKLKNGTWEAADKPLEGAIPPSFSLAVEEINDLVGSVPSSGIDGVGILLWSSVQVIDRI